MKPLRRRPLDLFLVACFSLFAFTSLVYEPFVVFGVDLAGAADPVGRSWFWYARSFDPVFLAPPLWLRILCDIDAFLFGPFYLVLVYALVRGRAWIRLPALLYGGAIVYSTLVYFGWELLDAGNRGRADLAVVVLVNLPYTVVPLILIRRMWRPAPFAGGVAASGGTGGGGQ